MSTDTSRLLLHRDRSDVREFDKCEIGRDLYPPHHHSRVVVAASAWLVLYVIAAIHVFTASGN
jgi:hypothetical protein